MKIKKYTPYLIAGIILIAVIGLLYYLSTQGAVSQALKSGKNGLYNPQTGNCEPTEYTGATFTCCYDTENYQVDCDNSLVRIGPKVLAVYQTPPGYALRGGFLSVQHGMTLTNNGNTYVDGWIESVTAVNTPSYPAGITAFNTAYSGVIGTSYKKGILPTQQVSWSSAIITLDNLAPTGLFTPTKYLVTYVFKATNSSIGITGSDTEVTDFNVTKEFVQISGGVSLG